VDLIIRTEEIPYNVALNSKRRDTIVEINDTSCLTVKNYRWQTAC